MEKFVATTHGYSDILGPPYFSVHADLRTQCYPLKPLKNAICLRAPGKQRYFFVIIFPPLLLQCVLTGALNSTWKK